MEKVKIKRIDTNEVAINDATKLEGEIARNILLNLWNHEAIQLKVGQETEIQLIKLPLMMKN